MEIELWSSFCESDASLSHPCFSFAFAQAMDSVGPRVFVAVLEKFGRTVGFMPFQFPNPAARILRWGERGASARVARREGAQATHSGVLNH